MRVHTWTLLWRVLVTLLSGEVKRPFPPSSARLAVTLSGA